MVTATNRFSKQTHIHTPLLCEETGGDLDGASVSVAEEQAQNREDTYGLGGVWGRVLEGWTHLGSRVGSLEQ